MKLSLFRTRPTSILPSYYVWSRRERRMSDASRQKSSRTMVDIALHERSIKEMRRDDKALLKALMIGTLPVLMIVASFFVGVSPAFAKSSAVSTSSHSVPSMNEDRPASGISCPAMWGVLVENTSGTPYCYPEGSDNPNTNKPPASFNVSPNIASVSLIQSGSYTIVVSCTDCTSRHVTHRSTFTPETPFYASQGVSYGGCQGALGVVTSIKGTLASPAQASPAHW